MSAEVSVKANLAESSTLVIDPTNFLVVTSLTACPSSTGRWAATSLKKGLCSNSGKYGCFESDNRRAARTHGLVLETLSLNLTVTSPLGASIGVDLIYRDCSICIGDLELIVDIFVLDLEGLDILIGMGILSIFYASLDCYSKKVTFSPLGRVIFSFVGDRKRVAYPRLEYHSLGLLAHLVGSDGISSSIVLLEVVRDFPNVFSEELPGLPSVRALEFKIELIPRTVPISMATYRMAPTKLRELKTQLYELLKIGFIRPSMSP